MKFSLLKSYSKPVTPNSSVFLQLAQRVFDNKITLGLMIVLNRYYRSLAKLNCTDCFPPCFYFMTKTILVIYKERLARCVKTVNRLNYLRVICTEKRKIAYSKCLHFQDYLFFPDVLRERNRLYLVTIFSCLCSSFSP